MQQPPLYLVSACLLGLTCRYDGLSKPSATCLQVLKNSHWIPFCPEQLGGLPTPRPAAELVNGDGHAVLKGQAQVLQRDDHQDASDAFIRGARQTLLLAQSQPVTAIFLKSRSPSCGVNGPMGVTAALLSEHGFSLREF
ncbi:MAG: DUF523 domain-containing protein [Desulfobulbaceae bacterium]|uniref:DUF523 domain-containing protein n=1 Tax=Candidatus Desulfatifera sulfidica TaxID=2841691 RepID=A0A8J6TCD9_9BACT|nr:DUF523 domain-containing protein [Candidatus Desulfatifera sulfidica]